MSQSSYCALSYKCNSNCLICVVDSGQRIDDLTTAQAKEFIDRIGAGGRTSNIEFSGGEPTIRSDFLEILEYAHSRYPQISYTLLSNCRRFADPAFSREVARLPVREIITALHGPSAESHDFQTRSKGSFAETYAGIRNLIEFNLNVTLKVIMTKLNYNVLPEIVDFIAQNFSECKSVTFNGLDIRGRAFQNKDVVAIRYSHIKPFLQEAIDRAVGYGLGIKTFSVPACSLDGNYRRYCGSQSSKISLYQSPSHTIEDKKDDYGHPLKCGSCSLMDKCWGAWNSYFEIFGDDEINPIQ